MEGLRKVAIRWFVGYGFHERLPHHSSLTRIRQRWGEQRFREIFKRTVEACLKAKIATGEIVHIDASLIRADVSWESLVEQHVGEVIEENKFDEEMEAEKRGRQSGKHKKVSTTDPDVTGGAFPRKVGGKNRTVTAGRRPWWPRMAGLQPLSTRAFGPRLRRLTALTALATRPLIATKRSTVRCGQSVCKCHAEKFRSAIFARILTAVHTRCDNVDNCAQSTP